MLLDMSYAANALRAWGSSDFIRYAQSETNDIYYSRDDDPSWSSQTAGVGPGGFGTNEKTARGARYHARNTKASTSQTKKRPGDDMFDVVLALWKKSATEYSEQHLQDTEAAEPTSSKGKVSEWLQSMGERE